MLKRISFVMLMVLVLSVALTACGGDASAPAPASAPSSAPSSAPASAAMTFSQLPVFSGAKVTTNDAVVAAFAPVVDALKADYKNIESKVYDVPADAKWDAIKSFYGTTLEKDGWTVRQSGADSQLWSHGTQGILVRYATGAGLIVVLLEAK